jgi:hypothetical protein
MPTRVLAIGKRYAVDSKTRTLVASSIPQPVSLTDSCAYSPAGMPSSAPACVFNAILRLPMDGRPPISMDSCELMAKLTNTCSTWVGSAALGPTLDVLIESDSGTIPRSGRLSHAAFFRCSALRLMLRIGSRLEFG